MKKEIEIVKQNYEEDPQKEWNRLDGFKYEFEITRRLLDRHAQPKRLLDIGGGPGRYSLYFAGLGYDVTLVDLSQGNVDFAKKKAAEMGLNITAYQADARDLSKLNLGEFDTVLIMGPLYHLSEEKDRKQCVLEAKKHLKKDGVLCASFLALNSMLNYCLDKELTAMLEEKETGLLECMQENKTWSGKVFTLATFVAADAIAPFFAELGFEKITLFGQEGIVANKLQQMENEEKEVQEFYLDMGLKLCENPYYFSYSSHLMYIGRKV